MNQSEFVTTILPLKDKLYRLAKRILVSKDEAEDAVQEVFFKLWKNRKKIEAYQSKDAFAITMTKNYCLDRLKSKQASNLKIVHTNYQAKDNLIKEIENNDHLNQIELLIEQLPLKQKLVFQMRDIEAMEFSEIANILEINETAVRVNLSRARTTLKEALIKNMNYGIK